MTSRLALPSLLLGLSLSLGTAACGDVQTTSGDTSSSNSGGAAGSAGAAGTAGAAGAAGSAGTGGECVPPVERLSLSLLSDTTCATDDPDMPMKDQLDGTFKSVADGFEVSSANKTYGITGAQPAIPDGTFVHLRYGCSPGFYGDAGAFVLLQNIDALDNMPNPTESGTRLWYFIAAGGEAQVPEELPFEYDREQMCTDGTFEGGFRSPQKLLLSGSGFNVSVPPSEQSTFNVPSGEQAGDYTAENVNIMFIGFPGGDATNTVNFRIYRAD